MMKKVLKSLVVILTLSGNLTATAQETGKQFSIATLNVDGLPQKILVVKVNSEGPGNGGTARIGKYLQKKGYDLVMLQEDFNYHDVLSVFLEDDYKMDEWTGNVDVVGHTIDYLHLQNHRFDCDGLMGCWKNDLQVTPAARIPWQQNFGKFSHAFDEMITKGFRRYEVTLRSGDRIVVYNMHMDASDDKDEAEKNDTKDKEARMAQWTQLKEDVLAQLDSRPIIVVGDMNSLYSRDDVKGVFIDAINESGRATVNDVWLELNKPGEETLDKILYINPVMGTKIQPVAFSLDKDGYLYEGKPLGDHYPVAATFKVLSRSTGIETMDNGQWIMENYYDLQGQKVTQPKRGIYIQQQGGKTDKRVMK
jgi:endonuclease/exonuclease/phosphatase family metal-dependent hydrolase